MEKGKDNNNSYEPIRRKDNGTKETGTTCPKGPADDKKRNQEAKEHKEEAQKIRDEQVIQLMEVERYIATTPEMDWKIKRSEGHGKPEGKRDDSEAITSNVEASQERSMDD